MKNSEILRHIEEIESMHNYNGRYKTTYALVCSLPDTELMQYVETHGFPDYLVKLIKRRGLEKQFITRQKSTVSRMLNLLSLHDCSKKTPLREGLKARFPFVPESYKQKILHCMLVQGTKKERLWAYTRLGWHWDDTFTLPIEQCYLEYREVESASLIVKNFPLYYIYQHRDELAAVAGWGYVMRRLGKEHPELVRKELLTPSEWIRTVTHLRLHQYENEIEDYLYQAISTEVEKLKNHESWYIHRQGDRRFFTLRDLPGVSVAVWSMGQMGMVDAIMRFHQYDQRFEWYLPENIPEDKQEELFYSWLNDIYNTIAVGKLGISSLI